MSEARPKVFNIATGQPFVDALAQGILARHGADPLALSRVKVFLPTRRACRGLAEAFLRVSEGKPMLLPAIRPLGDITEEVEPFAADLLGDEAAMIPPELPALTRQFLLMRLILARPEANNDPAIAAALAQDLGELLDGVITEGLDWNALDNLVPANLAEHWQGTLAFLDILRKHWPGILAERGAIDASERRVRMLTLLAERWRKSPPSDPVYAAGSTGSIPATAALLKVIAYLPQGAVVLPGLDAGLDEESYQAAADDPCHPQYGLARLLRALQVDRREVEPWQGAAAGPQAEAPRASLLREALRPAATTDRWLDGARISPAAFDDLGRVECEIPHDEALTIAVILREALERPRATAALITPDRGLARRVAAELQRWGVEIDDSAGTPLAQTPPGNFLRLVAQMIEQNFAPVPLLAALKHPLAQAGLARGRFLGQVREIEIAALRGPRPAPGIDGITRALAAAVARKTLKPETQAWFAKILEAARPCADLLAGGAVGIDRLLEAHLEFAEALTQGEDGKAALWLSDAGEALAAFAAEALAGAAALGPIAPARWPELLDQLLRGQTVRPKFGRHPRLFIWGLLEARLQQADLVILGGLNEGVWPPEPVEDPWFSRPMRAQFGLAPIERRIGLAAHDFVQAAGAPRVILSRAKKSEGSPATPSRWWLRLDAMLEGNPIWAATKQDPRQDWAATLDRPATALHAPAPAPRPPVAARPRRLSVTQVETLIRDPYAIFARSILGLRPLEDLDASADARDRGQMIHGILDKFIAAHLDDFPDHALTGLIALAKTEFANLADRPAIQAVWWPRFLRVADWFVANERAWRAQGRKPLGTEVSGQLSFAANGGTFELTARADRIDRLADGRLAILDYKTGTPPTANQVAKGFAPQLLLEAAIAEYGAFSAIAKAEVGELGYCRLSGGDPPGAYGRVAPYQPRSGALIETPVMVARAFEGLRNLIGVFDQLKTPYLSRPRPQFDKAYAGDYDHLARVAEWQLVAGDADD